MSQTPTQSAFEVGTNTVLGLVGSWFICYASMVLFSDRGAAAAAAVAGCTVWSLVRGYALRRYFERRQGK